MGDVGLVYQIAPADMSPGGVDKARTDLRSVPEVMSIQDESVFGATFFKILVVIPDKQAGALEAALDKLRDAQMTAPLNRQPSGVLVPSAATNAAHGPSFFPNHQGHL